MVGSLDDWLRNRLVGLMIGSVARMVVFSVIGSVAKIVLGAVFL